MFLVTSISGLGEAPPREVFESHEAGISQRKLSVRHQIGLAMVEHWYQSFVQKRLSKLASRRYPMVLAMNEHFFSGTQTSTTGLVLCQATSQ